MKESNQELASETTQRLWRGGGPGGFERNLAIILAAIEKAHQEGWHEGRQYQVDYGTHEFAMGLDGKKYPLNKLAVALTEAEGIPYSKALERVENYPGEPEQIDHPRGRDDSETCSEQPQEWTVLKEKYQIGSWITDHSGNRIGYCQFDQTAKDIVDAHNAALAKVKHNGQVCICLQNFGCDTECPVHGLKANQ